MATTTSITTTYAGEKKAGYISAALLSANTIEKGGIMVKPNIKFRETLKKMAVGDLIADGTCDFDATSSVTLTEKTLEPKEFQVNMQLCKQDYRSDWDAVSMGYSAFDNLPPTFQEFLLAEVVAKVATKNEKNIWQGSDAVAGEYDGLLTLLAADADLPSAQEVTGTTIDKDNVKVELGKVVDAIPAELYGNEDFIIRISQNVQRAYVRALGADHYLDKSSNQALGELMFDGVRLMVCNGLPSNTMIAGERDNFCFGTGVFNDMTEVKVIDMADIDGSQNVRIVMRFTAAVQYIFAEEIVTYGVANSAN